VDGKLAVIICFRCFESDFRWYFQRTFLKIKNVGKIKKNVKNVKHIALNKNLKNVFYIYGLTNTVIFKQSIHCNTETLDTRLNAGT